MVDRLVSRGRRSRSEVFSEAVREYVARRSPAEVTKAMDVCIQGEQRDESLQAAARRILEKVEW
jgi:predicted transcriptional regulator